MDPTGGPTPATFTDQYSSQLHSVFLSLYPQVSVAVTPHQRRFFVQKKEASTEIHTDKIAENNRCHISTPN